MKKIFLLGLFISAFGFAQQSEVKVDLKTPQGAINTHLYFLQPDSYQPQKAAAVIYGYKGEEAQNKAIKIKKILDGRGLRVDISKLPRNADFIDTTNIEKTHTYVLFPNRMPSIYLERIEGKWYYSAQTIANINTLYVQVYPWGTELLKSIIPNSFHKTFLGIELWQYLGFLILILLSYIVFHLFKRLIYFILRRIEGVLVKNTSEAVNQALNKLSRPITLLLVFWVFERLLPMLQLPLDVNLFLFLGIDIAIVIFWIYVFLKLVQVVMQVYTEIAEKTDSKLYDQLVPILNNILRVIVIIIGLFNLLTILGINTTALIAGASIGGLALAFASQDTVKNLIGTFMIFLDKPFQIGDWIEAGSVVGTVEEVGFRSTRVRAADTSLYQVPNSTLSEMVVNNKGLRLYRRYNTKLGLRYDTPPELIEAFVDGVRAIIKAHPATRSDAYNVEFTGFGDSALLVLMNTYFISLGWNEEQSAKHMLHLAIVKLAAALGVDFAFPSTTVIIEQFPDKQGFDMKYQTDQKIIDTKIKKIIEDFKNE